MKQTWTQTKAHLESVLPSHTFNTWIKPLSYRSVSENKLIIEVPNAFYKERILSSYANLILAKVRQISENHFLDVSFVLPDAFASSKVIESISKIKTTALFEKNVSRSKESINQRYTFDHLVVGSHNQFAHAAAMAVCDAPGQLYNPLFIYGGVGLGKTHLLCAIGNEILKRSPQKRVVYQTSEDFVNQLIQSIRNQRMNDFRTQHRQGLDVLLIDDIQFFSGKERTQEEFFHTFNALHQFNVQIVLTSDRMPKDIPELDERLRSRFEWGLFCDVTVPDLETRVAILRKKADSSGVDLPDDVADFLASENTSNIRSLEGVFISLVAKSSLQKRPLTLEFAKEVFASHPKIPPNIEEIQRHVSSFYNLAVSTMRSSCRQKAVALPRQIAMFLARKHTASSYPDIGKKFGGKDHSTVIHAVEKIERLVLEDNKFRHTVEAIEKSLSLDS
ncbi:MAG: chromosomal replication initiator protein DnaA [Bdellovibrionales bacterium]|nr:chromosomal replication initiator protein DnaA [Bdellovibrionales bacterium]